MENSAAISGSVLKRSLPGKLNYYITISNGLRTIDDESIMRVEMPCSVSMTNVKDDADVFELTFGSLIINGHADGEYDQWEWLYAKIFSMNNVLLIKTDTTGKITRVGEKTEIIKRWKEARADILVTFDEEEAEAIVSTMDKEFDQNLKQLYHNDTLLNFLFNDIYHQYNHEPVATPKTLLKHFGPVEVPIIEYKTLIDANTSANPLVVSIKAAMLPDQLDLTAVNDYLAKVNHFESDEDNDYTFHYEGLYNLHTDAKYSYIEEAELKISGSFGEYFEKVSNYHIKLQANG